MAVELSGYAYTSGGAVSTGGDVNYTGGTRRILREVVVLLA